MHDVFESDLDAENVFQTVKGLLGTKQKNEVITKDTSALTHN